jgi:hypothetical protein
MEEANVASGYLVDFAFRRWRRIRTWSVSSVTRATAFAGYPADADTTLRKCARSSIWRVLKTLVLTAAASAYYCDYGRLNNPSYNKARQLTKISGGDEGPGRASERSTIWLK